MFHRRPHVLTSPVLILVVVASLGSAAHAPAAELKLYVSTRGNDAWSGRLESPNPSRSDGPVATIAKARDLVRKARQGGPTEAVTVFVRGGTYEFTETFRLSNEDGGTAASPVVYRSYPREQATLRGGRRVRGFVPHRGKILKADLAAQGLKGAAFSELFCGGKRLPLARYPNFDPANPYGGGWAFADGRLAPMYENIPGEDSHTLRFKPQDARTWSKPAEVQVFVFPRYNWWNNIVGVKSIDPATRTIQLASDASYPIRPGDRYYVRNALEELDAPGEWYLDRDRGTLYLWPPAPLDDAHAIVAPTIGTLVAIGPKTEYLSLRGFTMESCTGEAVSLDNTSHCTLAGCTIRGVGDYSHGAVGVNGGTNNRVVGNDISDVGSHGIYLSGGDRVALTPAGNVADNNYIHHVGVRYAQGVGIGMEGVGNVASHNYIHDGPRMGIMFSGNNLIIEYNHVRHMNLETEDTGAVYTGGRDWISSRGTIIRYNRFHDMLGFGKDEHGRWVSPHFAWGIYLDDNTGGVDVIGNIVYRCSRAGLHLHNGRDNHISNNIFVDNGPQQYEYSGWRVDHSYWKDHLPTMIKGYEMVRDSPAWKSMRNMGVHPRDAVLPNGLIMTGNEFTRNIIAYRGAESALVRTNDVPFDRNVFDDNLVWHDGKPIRTGQRLPGKDISGDLIPGDFSTAEVGKLPEGWEWQIFTPSSAAGIVEDGGRRVLRIEAAFDASKSKDNSPIVVTKLFPARPGHTYRLKARMRSTGLDAKAGLMLQGYEARQYFWANWPNECKVGPEWKDFEFVFKIPAPGEPGHHERMKDFRVRIDFPARSGGLLVSGVSFREVESLDEWASWQLLGMDRRSRIADPRFVDAAHDDYRLRPDSPALTLGFSPIPEDRIGPYRDDLRASWPIVDAPGAREHPVTPPR
ncbi:right-handed parallel beta-helix repeat-containing protein [Aquisphaera insulae]|uniref:right-handed parallel beta-helix repeat-containing protein n=1 Tax=Aquisphaera insulae TaxID=2712864 RepID=UPI0013ED112F|nr:right-handed parallel beta-helix repeat-containing protein [Aquisphaera insulae]